MGEAGRNDRFAVKPGFCSCEPGNTWKGHRRALSILLIGVLLNILVPDFCFSQQKTDSVKPKPAAPPPKNYVMIGRLKFHPSTSWVIVGPAFDINRFTTLDGSLGISYHFTYKDNLYQVGVMRGEDWEGSFLPMAYSRVFNSINVAIGLKEETKKMFYAFFIGPSLDLGEYIDPQDLTYASYTTVGLHTDIQVVYKAYYDVGIGTDLFGDINSKYTVIGLRLVLFFSDAYKKGR